MTAILCFDFFVFLQFQFLIELHFFRKNDTILGSDVRKFVTKYVKEANCQDPTNPKYKTYIILRISHFNA